MIIISKAQFDPEENHGNIEYIPIGYFLDDYKGLEFIHRNNRVLTKEEFRSYRMINLYKFYKLDNLEE